MGRVQSGWVLKAGLFVLLLAGPGLAVCFSLSSFQVDKSSVTVQRRPSRDWLFLDSAVSGYTSRSIESLLATITDYQSYPVLLPRIKEVKEESQDGAVLLTSKVVISAIGIEDVNLFTLKYVLTEVSASPRVVRIDWTQAWTDGTIDSMAGGWLLEDQSTADAVKVHVSYWSQSAIPSYALGEKEFIELFLGSETKSWVDIIDREAGKKL